MCESPDAAGKGLSLGVLIIGSLYWDNAHREQWRQERLDLNHKLWVHAPIRYGRQSGNRGNSYTMVFSAGLREADFGTAIVVPCKLQDPVEEAKRLWAAEGGNSGISGNWGCVGLLTSPRSRVLTKQCKRWSKLVAGRPGYGQLTSTDGESAAVDAMGFLTIPWPKLVDGSTLMLDALLATATDPTLVQGIRYPSTREIAKAWDTPRGREHIHYFCENRKSGIQTFQDEEIEGHLRDLGHVC